MRAMATLLLALAIVWRTSAVAGVLQTGQCVVNVSQDAITATIHGLNKADTARCLERSTGVVAHVPPQRQHEPVEVGISGWPLAAGFRQVFGASVALTYRGNALIEVAVLGDGSTQSVPEATRSPVQRVASPQPVGRRPEPAAPHGSPGVSVSSLLEVAQGRTTPRERIAAIQSLAMEFPDDPMVEEALVTLAETDKSRKVRDAASDAIPLTKAGAGYEHDSEPESLPESQASP